MMATERNIAFEGSALTFAERGLLAYALDKFNNGKMRIEDVMQEGNIGRDYAYTLINSLIKKGYARRVIQRDVHGKYIGKIWEFYEEPVFAEADNGIDTYEQS